jgi:hypothetical protein
LPEKKFSHIRITNHSIRGNYYGAYHTKDKNSQQGYNVFISRTKGVHNTCECEGYIFGKECYHIKEAQKLEGLLFG